MQLELYHVVSCPFSALVRDYIEKNGLKGRIAYHETDEDPKAAERLAELTGGKQVPCLIVDGKPLLESKEIVTFLARNVVGKKAA